MIIISFLLISLYIMYCIINKGIPHSLSATYYDNGWVFSAVLLLSTILITPKMLEITPIKYQFLAFISLCGSYFVAIAPNFRSDILTDRVHTGGAVISLISSQLWVMLMGPINLLSWIPVIIYGIFMIKRKYKLLDIPKIKFIAEVVMLLNIYNILWRT